MGHHSCMYRSYLREHVFNNEQAGCEPTQIKPSIYTVRNTIAQKIPTMTKRWKVLLQATVDYQMDYRTVPVPVQATGERSGRWSCGNSIYHNFGEFPRVQGRYCGTKPRTKLFENLLKSLATPLTAGGSTEYSVQPVCLWTRIFGPHCEISAPATAVFIKVLHLCMFLNVLVSGGCITWYRVQQAVPCKWGYICVTWRAGCSLLNTCSRKYDCCMQIWWAIVCGGQWRSFCWCAYRQWCLAKAREHMHSRSLLYFLDYR